MSTNLEYGERERQRKRESRRQAIQAQREKGRHRSRAREKKGDIFLLEEQHENFVAAVTKWEMLAATNARWKWAAVKKKVNENTYDISSIKKSFWRFHDVVVQNNGKEMYKKVCCTCKVAFLLIRPIVVFHRSPALPSPLSITRFYLLFEQT